MRTCRASHAYQTYRCTTVPRLSTYAGRPMVHMQVRKQRQIITTVTRRSLE